MNLRSELAGQLFRTFSELGLVVLLGVVGVLYKTEKLWFVHPAPWQFQVKGLDISHHQGEIEWWEVHYRGYEFTWIKATEGGDWVDPMFATHATALKDSEIYWGPYHFFSFCTDPELQAQNFLNVVLPVYPTSHMLPFAVDVESGGNCTGSTEKLGEQLESFLEIVESALMIRGVLYLIPEQVPLLFGEGEVPDRARWVRNLFGPPAIIEGRPARFWQYHNHAWVSGVREPVDVNVFDGSLAELSAWAFDSRMPERLKPQPDSTLKFH